MLSRPPRNREEFAAWIDSLSDAEKKSVWEAVMATTELRALVRVLQDVSIKPLPTADIQQSTPRPATIHLYFGWREVKKWILVGIARRNGSAETADVIDFVFGNIKDELLPDDLEPTDETPEPRWRNRVRWERENLADQGYLHRGPRGVWTLTAKGRGLMGL